MLTRQEENKASTIAAITSTAIIGGLIVLLIFWMIPIPDPPFSDIEVPEGAEQGGTEVSLGTDMTGWGKISEYKIEAQASTPATNENSTPPSNNNNEIVSNVGVNINQSNSNTTHTTTANNNNTNTNNNPVKNYANALNNANNSQGNNINNPHGVLGQPDGSITGGATGTGTATGGTGNTGTGTATSGTYGPSGGIKFGRKLRTLPCKVDDSNAEGVVEVIIKVDKDGNVIDADPNGPGTDTSNSGLKSKARQAAFCAKFEACKEADCPAVSKGSIIFNFVYGGK
ncbi:MAG: hypothetical protein IAF38_13985 [Bacteroidia bacterium]|nr:hypothetical protein [Bacteroidia bacterium]